MNHNESPHIQSQCCCKKILMFDYISLTMQIEVPDELKNHNHLLQTS